MTANETTWTVNAIKEANLAAGGHWFDPDTMRCFGTKVLPVVYQGDGGVYFVTRDKDFLGRHGYTVRQFDPASGHVHSASEVAALTRERAVRTARELRGRVGLETAEDYRPVSVEDQFAHDLQRHTNPARGTETRTVGIARALMKAARSHHRYMEMLCSDEAFCRQVNDDGDHPRVTALRAKITALAESAGAGVLFSGDPRGCTVKLVFRDGATNDFGKEGWCVPTEMK